MIPHQPGLDLARQQRNLLLFSPLYELALKIRRGDSNELLFAGLDTNYLALSLLDFIMEGGVLGPGRALQETLAHLANIVQRMKPALTEQDTRKVAREVLDALHNASGKFERFEYEYFDSVTGKSQRHAFALLKYERASDNQYYYRVSDEGFLVYLGMLDLGAANMQEFMEKMLHELVRRGRVNEALDVSRQAYLQATRYVDSIRSRLSRAQRMPDSVTWKRDLETFLSNARDHLDQRQVDERQLLEVVTDKLRDGTDLNTRDNLVKLKDTLEAELNLSSRLLTLIGEAGQSYLKAQAALFRARTRQNLPDLEERLLPDFLNLTVQQLQKVGDTEGHALFSGVIPKLLNLGPLVELLLEPQPESGSQGPDNSEITLLKELPPHFSEEDNIAATQFLQNIFVQEPRIDIETILIKAEQAGLRHQVRELMTFRMFQTYSQAESNFNVDAHATGRFANDMVEGVNLTFTKRDKND